MISGLHHKAGYLGFSRVSPTLVLFPQDCTLGSCGTGWQRERDKVNTKEISLGRLREPRTLAALGLPGEQKFLPLAFSPMSLKHPSNMVSNTYSRGILYPQ